MRQVWQLFDQCVRNRQLQLFWSQATNPFDPYTDTTEYENCALDELCQRVDVLTLHLPYVEKTHNLIGSRQFQLMKKGSFVINISRGGLIDEFALLQALKSEHIAGAALDCFGASI